MRTPSACSSLTSDEPARNQRSSASTERNARRFVVTAGKPSLMSKRMTSPKMARVPVPVRSSRSTPDSIALRRIARYCRTASDVRRWLLRRDSHDPEASWAQSDLTNDERERRAEVVQPLLDRGLDLLQDRRGQGPSREVAYAQHELPVDRPGDDVARGAHRDDRVDLR